jgi:hypothetical protein
LPFLLWNRNIRPSTAITGNAIVGDRELNTCYSHPQKQAIEYGIDRTTFQRMKRRIEKDHEINLNTPAVKKD